MYIVNSKPLQIRKELIARAQEAAQEFYPFYECQNNRCDLPVIRLDINCPVYRMENYRTRIAQLKYINDHQKPVDFFQSGQENDSAQQAQHLILVDFAREGRKGSISPIFDELKKEDQREPILITSGGVVVNGNRRLAAMRELFAESPEEFRRFGYVNCAVLPVSITPDEVREIEIRLQMRPETKLPYGWVNESLAIHELLQSGKNADYIAGLMKKRKKDVERAARALTEANIYLQEWLRKPGEYQYVEDAEQFFGDLAKALEPKTGEALELSRRIAWSLLSNVSRLRRRVYDYNFSFDRRTEEVITALIDRAGIDIASKDEASEPESDELEIDLGDRADGTSLEPLIDAFDDLSSREALADELISVCDTILERDREGEIGRRALAVIQAANSKLQEVDLSKAEKSTYEAIEAQLDSIIQRATRLRDSLSAYRLETAN